MNSISIPNQVVFFGDKIIKSLEVHLTLRVLVLEFLDDRFFVFDPLLYLKKLYLLLGIFVFDGVDWLRVHNGLVVVPLFLVDL